MKHLVRIALSKLGYRLIKDTQLIKNNDIAFLHIGKNAGTQIRNVCSKLKKYRINIRIQKHKIKLIDLTPDIPYFFSIRDPSDRFKSGFYSRKRKGQPLSYHEWNEHERLAFDKFNHANDLAEALFIDSVKGKDARSAIKSIIHTGMQQVDWFQHSAFLIKRPPLFIIRQNNFVSDVNKLLKILNVPVNASDLIIDDPLKKHANDYSNTPALSKLALDNLKKWYIQDYFFYEMCEEWIGLKDVG